MRANSYLEGIDHKSIPVDARCPGVETPRSAHRRGTENSDLSVVCAGLIFLLYLFSP